MPAAAYTHLDVYGGNPDYRDQREDNFKNIRRTDPVSSRRETRALYDRLARWYDLLGGAWENELRQEALRKLNPQAGEAILEIGAGTGQALPGLAAGVGAHGKVFAVDLSPKMLAQAQARLARENLPERVFLLCGDAVRLPYGAAQVDAVFLSFTLELFPTPEIPAVLVECRRVLRSGGRLVLISLSERGPATPVKRLYTWMHGRLPSLVDCRPIQVQACVLGAEFELIDCSLRFLWGLPVEVVIARKQGDGEGLNNG
jgi:demethylmenaquinone methyltransferase/2-methoxy-6-polyprenyl-1,4-benzoquinol methylase